MSPDDRNQTFSCGPDDCLAFVVGGNRFQNALCAAYIEAHSPWKSVVADGIAPLVPAADRLFPRRTAVLYDCFGLKGRALEESVLTGAEQLPPAWQMVLFNLERHTGIEKKALEYGVHGFFYLNDSVETFISGLTAISGGELWIPRRMMADAIHDNGFRLRQGANHARTNGLTRREKEVLGLLARGASNKAIAKKLFISPHTVRTHLTHIFRKIGVASRLEASVWAAHTLPVRD